MTRSTKIGVAAAFLLGAAFAAPLAIYGAGGNDLIAIDTGPGGVERVEFYGPNRWEAWLYDRGYDMPGQVRLTNVNNSTVLGTSPLFELSGTGPVSWTDYYVLIGYAAFDRRKKEWVIQGD